MKAHVLRDKPVVSMADGTKVGSVQELLFDTTKFRLAAFLLTGDGGKSVLPFEGVRNFGDDVITVENASATEGVQGNTALDAWRGWKDVSQLRVINGEGSWLGDIRDLEVDPKDGHIGEITAHRGGLLGLGGSSVTIPASAIRGIGPKVITVDTPAAGDEQPSPR